MLEVKNVSYVYKSKYQSNEVLHGITCSFEKGLMYAVMGPSGSGKTTLLSLLAGLDLPAGGEIYVDGKSMASIDRDEYRRCTASVIYQSFHLFPLLTALENVMYPMRLRGMPKAEAEVSAKRYIAQMNLGDDILRKRPLMMSGGEQQRIAIARAFAAGGQILLADEPTGNLDSANGAAVTKILRDIAHEMNYTVIVITHSEAVAECADVIFHIVDGRLAGNPS